MRGGSSEARADWCVSEGVGRLDTLLEAAGGIDFNAAVDAARTLRRLAGLTLRLEDLQRRRRSGTHYQSAMGQQGLEQERRALVEKLRASSRLQQP